MNYFLTIILILSLSIASIRVFHPEQYVMQFFKKTQEQVQEKKEAQLSAIYTTIEHVSRGNIYLKQGFAELARDEFVKAVNKDPKNQIAYIRLADTQMLLKNYQGAFQNLEHAEQINNTADIQLKKAQNLIHLNSFEKATATLKPLQGQGDEIDYTLFILFLLTTIDQTSSVPHSDTFAKSATLQKAFDEFALYKGSQTIYLKALIAKALVSNKDFEIAIQILNSVLSERSDYRDAWIMLGYSYMNLENYTKAQESLSHAYDLDPTKAETQYFLGVALEEMGNKTQALEFYQLAYKNKYEPRAHVIQKIAELSLEFGDYQEAFNLYAELVKTTHENVDSFIRPVWIALSKLSNLEKAQQVAEWALAAYPNEAQSYNLLAWVSIEKGNFNQAQTLLNQAFKINPNFAAAHYNQGLLYEKKGNEKKALASYEMAYQIDKNGPIGGVAAEAYNRLEKQ